VEVMTDLEKAVAALKVPIGHGLDHLINAVIEAARVPLKADLLKSERQHWIFAKERDIARAEREQALAERDRVAATLALLLKASV
jgi:hypothetical protein